MKALDRTCKNCGHWEQNGLESGFCRCAISPFYDQLLWDDVFCDFWKGIDE